MNSYFSFIAGNYSTPPGRPFLPLEKRQKTLFPGEYLTVKDQDYPAEDVDIVLHEAYVDPVNAVLHVAGTGEKKVENLPLLVQSLGGVVGHQLSTRDENQDIAGGRQPLHEDASLHSAPGCGSIHLTSPDPEEQAIADDQHLQDDLGCVSIHDQRPNENVPEIHPQPHEDLQTGTGGLLDLRNLLEGIIIFFSTIL